MKKAMVLLSLSAAFVASLATLVTAGPAHAAPPPAPFVRCHTGALGVALAGSSGGVGHVGLLFRVSNHSVQACDMYGYPGVLLLDALQVPLATYVTWGPGYLSGNQPRRTVHLAPGASASFTLEWVHVPTPGQTCPTASYVRITPPDEHSSLRVSVRLNDVCGGKLTVSPITATPNPGFDTINPPGTTQPAQVLAGPIIFGRDGGNIRPFRVGINASGTVTSTGAVQPRPGQLSADTLAGLRTLARAEGFAAMPAQIIGPGLHPDVATFYITMSTTSGAKTVRLHAADNVAFAQLFAVLEAVAGVAS